MVRVETYSGNGTGFIFETTGQTALVLTNYHVIDDANLVQVVVNDSETYRATVRGYDAYRDLAVLEICCGDFHALAFHESQDVKSGSEVIAIGYALGFSGSATVTRGIISAVRYAPEHRAWVFQTDAPINPGNSGGPLLLPTGEIIGINTFVYRGYDAEGLGFAIAEQSIKSVLSGLKQGTRVGFPTPTPNPTPATAAIQWRTYTNREYGYTIKVPADWEIDDSEKDYVTFDSPDGFDAGAVVFVPDYYIRSAEARLLDYFEDLKQDYHLFELLDRNSVTDSDGAEVAYIRFRRQYSPILCIEEGQEWLWVYGSTAYWLSLSACEHSLNEYEPVLDSIFDSFTFN